MTTCISNEEMEYLLRLLDEVLEDLIMEAKTLISAYIRIGRRTCESLDEANNIFRRVVENLRNVTYDLERIQYLLNNPDRIAIQKTRQR